MLLRTKHIETKEPFKFNEMQMSGRGVWTKHGVGHGLGHGLPHGLGHGLGYGLPYGLPYGLLVVRFLKKH